MKHAQRRHRTKPASGPSLLERITPNAAGIDCGSEDALCRRARRP